MTAPTPSPSGERLTHRGVAIALGANLGDPAATLIALRAPLLAALGAWWPTAAGPPRVRWSPLFRTQPVGGPPGQPDYLNAVLLADPEPPATAEPLALLRRLQDLEDRFGRRRREHWGPRTLDLDLLWCGPHRSDTAVLRLPHPGLRQRSFVLAPLAAIDPGLVVPPPVPASPCADLLAALLPQLSEAPPVRLPPRPGWPE